MDSTLNLNKDVMAAVESLKYRVTVGDVAAQSGLNVELAQQGLLALASETQAHLQVSEAGEIAYEFPKNFRGVLRNKYWQLRLQETLAKIWQVVFYIIRLSFGLMLLLSIRSDFYCHFCADGSSEQSGWRWQGDRDVGGVGGGSLFFPSNIFYLLTPIRDAQTALFQSMPEAATGADLRRLGQKASSTF